MNRLICSCRVTAAAKDSAIMFSWEAVKRYQYLAVVGMTDGNINLGTTAAELLSPLIAPNIARQHPCQPHFRYWRQILHDDIQFWQQSVSWLQFAFIIISNMYA